MLYENYNFWGMHLVWWFAWGFLLFWIFLTPYNIPGQRTKNESPLEILKRRFASGQITQDQYLEYKSTLDKN